MAIGLENLKIYRLAEELEIEVYRVTKKFPADEKYRSINQLRRSLSSASDNIAEAYNKRSTKEKIHILNDIAKCEAEETKRGIFKSAKKDFLPTEEALKIANRYTELMKGISGYIKFLKNQQEERGSRINY